MEIENDDAGSTEFLNAATTAVNTTAVTGTTMATVVTAANSNTTIMLANSPFKTQRQRSLTPDRNESHSSSSSLRKQRSLTPESRSLTPEDRRKRGSQASLMGSRQNSTSRNNTLERKHDKAAINHLSRSSSSSSYSGRGEHDSHIYSQYIGGNLSASGQHRRSLGRNAKQVDDHRIRRSR